MQPPCFTYQQEGNVLTYVFRKADDLRAALRRVAGFYEDKQFRQQYLPLDSPHTKDLCRYYEGFNFPLLNVLAWLDALQAFHQPPNDATAPEETEEMACGWQAHCVPQETAWLEHMHTFLATIDKDDVSQYYIIACDAAHQKTVCRT